MKIELPECMTVDVSVYVTSPSSGATAAIACARGKALSDDFDGLIQGACTALNGMAGVSDARPMTRAEVAAYCDAQERGDDEDDGDDDGDDEWEEVEDDE